MNNRYAKANRNSCVFALFPTNPKNQGAFDFAAI